MERTSEELTLLEHQLPQNHGCGAGSWVPAPVSSHFSPGRAAEGAALVSPCQPVLRVRVRYWRVSCDGEMALRKVLRGCGWEVPSALC